MRLDRRVLGVLTACTLCLLLLGNFLEECLGRARLCLRGFDFDVEVFLIFLLSHPLGRTLWLLALEALLLNLLKADDVLVGILESHWFIFLGRRRVRILAGKF